MPCYIKHILINARVHLGRLKLKSYFSAFRILLVLLKTAIISTAFQSVALIFFLL